MGFLDDSPNAAGWIERRLTRRTILRYSFLSAAAITKMVGDNLLSLNVKMGEKASAEAAK